MRTSKNKLRNVFPQLSGQDQKDNMRQLKRNSHRLLIGYKCCARKKKVRDHSINKSIKFTRDHVPSTCILTIPISRPITNHITIFSSNRDHSSTPNKNMIPSGAKLITGPLPKSVLTCRLEMP